MALAAIAVRAEAAAITNNSAADTSLVEIEPSHNLGGLNSFISGHIQNPFKTRALMRFDLTELPTNTIIREAVLELVITRQPVDGFEISDFGLHRMLRPWGEGDKVPIIFPGQGLLASDGEATWSHAFYPTNGWAEPGGSQGFDFAFGESSFAQVGETNDTPRFPSTPEMVDDVQSWVSNPDGNYGWILISNEEETLFTARHFGSREDENNHPRLEVHFFVPPRFDSVARVGNEFQMRFTSWSGQSYAVEYRTNVVSGTWQTLVNLGVATTNTQVLVTDAVTAGQRYYRLATSE